MDSGDRGSHPRAAAPLAPWDILTKRKARRVQETNMPLVQDLVLIGGGHTHALVLRKWAMRPLAGVRVTVINPGAVAPYTGMLPGHIAGHYTRAEMMIDLVALVRFAGARVILNRVTGIDRVAKRVILADGAPVSYDVASVDIGIGSDLPNVDGFAAHGLAAKPLGHYSEGWDAFVAKGMPAPHLVIVGAGIGGVELALASAHRLRAAGVAPKITLLERASAALPHIGKGARAALLAHLARADISVLTGVEAVALRADAVELRDGRVLPSDFTLSVAGARPQAWLADTGLALQDGFLVVNPALQTSDPQIFAVGDCAHLAHAPRPKAGVFAVREAPILFDNLRAVLSGVGALRPYHPQRDYLKLVSTGGKGAVADKLGLRLDGAWLWRWKDRIDRKFMAKFADYPAMPAPQIPAPHAIGLVEALGDKPLCGGCGAKLGADALAGVLAALPTPMRADVLSGPGDDAAVLRMADGVQVMTTDHLRAFTDDFALMARLTAVHALGDIWAMGAAPQVALAQITLPRLSERLQAETLREIMAAAGAVFRVAGADIVGGHTSVGAELTIGFTVTGVAQRIITKGGAQAGDVVILTKPLGTGAILAAEMAGIRPDTPMLGEAVAGAFTAMLQPLASAAQILTPQAHAMTDVTGFGLAGHMLEILRASGCGATLNLADIPLLSGALSLAQKGVASTLAPANRAACLGQIHAPNTAQTALLYDPQTCGGLLACVAPQAAADILAQLQAVGHPAAIIGEITAGAPHLRVI